MTARELPDHGIARHEEPDHAADDGMTGDDEIDTTLRSLNDIDDLQVADHVARYEAVHATLQDRLSNVDGS